MASAPGGYETSPTADPSPPPSRPPSPSSLQERATASHPPSTQASVSSPRSASGERFPARQDHGGPRVCPLLVDPPTSLSQPPPFSLPPLSPSSPPPPLRPRPPSLPPFARLDRDALGRGREKPPALQAAWPEAPHHRLPPFQHPLHPLLLLPPAAVGGSRRPRLHLPGAVGRLGPGTGAKGGRMGANGGRRAWERETRPGRQ